MDNFFVLLVLDLITAGLWYNGIIMTIRLIRDIKLEIAEKRKNTKGE